MTGSILEGHRLLVPPKWMDTEGWEWTALLALARTPGGCVSASDRQIEAPLTVYQRFGDAISQTRDALPLPPEPVQETARGSFDQLTFREEANYIARLSMSSAHNFSHLSLFLVATNEQIGEDVHGVYGKYSGSSVPPVNHKTSARPHDTQKPCARHLS
ncbi:hypothetical protein ACSS6W_000503 [Trichoderma asperelloides]